MAFDERREVAARLRQIADAHGAVEASRVAHALGLEYEVHGTVVAFGSDAVQALADLIDPTCEINKNPDGYGYSCSRCNSFASPSCRPYVNGYCMHCGARVVNINDAD